MSREEPPYFSATNGELYTYVIRGEDVDILQAAINSERQPSQCRDRNEVEAKATIKDPPNQEYWKKSTGTMGNVNGEAWSDHELDEGYRQIQHEFVRTGHRKQQQDMNKPIANIGGRTCFKYDSSGPIPERQGQITSDTTFGAALRNVARRPDVKRIIETGTWYGGGSTHEVEESSSHLTSILSNTYALEENYAIHIKYTHCALLASSVLR